MSGTETLLFCIALTLGFRLLVQRLVSSNEEGDPSAASTLKQAEKRLELAGNIASTIFLIFTILKFGLRSGWIAQAAKAVVLPMIAIPALVWLALYAKARLDVKRARKKVAGTFN